MRPPLRSSTIPEGGRLGGVGHGARRSSTVGFVAVLLVASTVACGSDGDGRVAVPGASAATTAAPTSGAPASTGATTAPTTTATPTTVVTTVPTTTPPTTPPTTGPTTTAVPTTLPALDGPYYRAGDEGPEIALIQLKLVAVGFLEPGYTEGVFDRATNDAVIRFQGQYGLLVDGVVGPATELSLTAAAVSVDADDG